MIRKAALATVNNLITIGLVCLAAYLPWRRVSGVMLLALALLLAGSTIEAMLIGTPARRVVREDRQSAIALLFAQMFMMWAAMVGSGLRGVPPLLAALGLALIAGGVALRICAVKILGPFFFGEVSIAVGHRLVTSGLYRRVRHPSYSGAVLATLGMVVIGQGTWLVDIAGVASLSAIGYRIMVEEESLQRRFGSEYQAYRSRTRMLIPWIL